MTGGESTVYLFGSVHLLPEGGFTIGGALAEALEEADRVCMEIDPDAQSEAETTSITLARAVDPEGRDLSTCSGGRPGARAAEDAGIPLEALAMFEPWFAGLTVSLMALQANGFDVEHGVKQIIQAEARRDGKSGCGLETFDGQLGMLDGCPRISRGDPAAGARRSGGRRRADRADARRLARRRRGGSRTSLEDDFDGYPELADALIYERNARWAEQVSEMLRDDDDVLVIVGAMHLVGERGLPALLENRGFRVQRR